MQQPNPTPTSLRTLLRRLVDDTRGGILALSVILLLFVLGAGGLILDFGRVWGSQSELQTFADHAALVAAGELDGALDSIDRANAALAQLITDNQSYASQDATLDSTDVTATFLSDLPASDTDNNFGPFVTNDPTQAQFVQVVVNPHTVSTIFANVLLTVAGNPQVDIDVGAAAVAGFTQYTCDVTPLMFCPPNGMSRETARSWLPGRQIRLKTQGGGSAWSGGVWGLLDLNFDPDGPCGPPNGGANYWRCAMAAEQSITRCFSRRGVDIRPGEASGPSSSGINTRVDIYATSLKSKKNDPNFAPAPNVIKGFKPGGNGCVASNPEPSNVAPLPQAQCLLDENCADGRFSPNTVDPADRQAYIDQNYPGGAPPGLATASTRWQMYNLELDNAGAGDILDTGAGLEESGRPTCSSNMSSDRLRRVLVAAAVDCSTLGNGNQSDVPVMDFYRVFLTNPAGEPTNQDIWVEVIEQIDPFGGGAPGPGIMHDFVQLYR